MIIDVFKYDIMLLFVSPGRYPVTRGFCGSIVFVWSRWFDESPSTARTRLCNTNALLELKRGKKVDEKEVKYRISILRERADIY